MELINLSEINKEVLVEASQQTAFKVFTERMDLWWPRTHHIGKTDLAEIVLEPFVNGRWYAKHVDGSRSDNGYVISYNPYGLLILAWQINGDFECDPDLVTEVVVEFIVEGPKTTRVKLAHKDLQKLGNDKAVAGMNTGWGMILELFKQLAEQ